MELREEKKYLVWLNQHSKTLRKYAGQWVGIKLGRGVVAAGKSLKKVRQDFLRHYPHETPHLLQVPPKGQRFYILFSLPGLLLKAVAGSAQYTGTKRLL